MSAREHRQDVTVTSVTLTLVCDECDLSMLYVPEQDQGATRAHWCPSCQQVVQTTQRYPYKYVQEQLGI